MAFAKRQGYESLRQLTRYYAHRRFYFWSGFSLSLSRQLGFLLYVPSHIVHHLCIRRRQSGSALIIFSPGVLVPPLGVAYNG